MSREVDAFLNTHMDEVDSYFGTSTMVCDGQTFMVVLGQVETGGEGELGGMAGDVRAIATAQSSDVSSADLLFHKRCTVDGVAYRVGKVYAGTVSTRFELQDVNQSS